MADTKRSREEKGKNKDAYRRRRDIERARSTADEDVEFEELLEPADEDVVVEELVADGAADGPPRQD